MHLCCCEQGTACALVSAPIILTEGALDLARMGTAAPLTGRSGTLPGGDMSIDRETRPRILGPRTRGPHGSQAVEDQDLPECRERRSATQYRDGEAMA